VVRWAIAAAASATTTATTRTCQALISPPPPSPQVVPESSVDAVGSSLGSAVLAAAAEGRAAAGGSAPPATFLARRLPGATCDAVCLAAFSDHGEPVWRVDWNITGTVLTSSGDDGMVHLRRRTLAGHWECVKDLDTTKEALVAAGGGGGALGGPGGVHRATVLASAEGAPAGAVGQ
jgi:hypothetical protein